MIPYASRTGTRVNLTALRAAGWRLMVSARGVLRHEGMKYALDNGAWTAHQRNEPFDERAFLRALDRLGAGADFIVAPDIVCGGRASLRFSERWLPRISLLGRPILLAVQNGIAPEDVRSLLCPELGIFVGGDTAWKETSLPLWGELATETGCYLHVGRVNTIRRITLCALAQAHSFDGTSASRYRKSLPRLDQARRQPALRFF